MAGNKKIGKKTKIKKQNSGKTVLSNKVHQLLADQNQADLVLFEKDYHCDENNYSSLDSFASVDLPLKKEKAINLNIVHDLLDVYRSPHLLDLSSLRFIERVRPSLGDIRTINYQDLPAGDFLAKWYIFELISLEQSEILIWLKNFYRKIIFLIRRQIQRVDLSPKLPLIKRENFLNRYAAVGQEITLINFFIFIFSGILRLFLPFYWLVFYLMGRQPWSSDEVIDFSLKKINLSSSAPALGDFLSASETSIRSEAVDHFSGRINQESFISKINSRFDWFNFSWFNWRINLRPVAVFAILAALFILPVKSFNYWQQINQTKGEVLGQTETALYNFQLAQEELTDFNFQEAESYFTAAAGNFQSAQKTLNQTGRWLTFFADTLPLNNPLRSGKNLLDLGANLSAAGEFLLRGLNGLTSETEISLADKIEIFQKESATALTRLEIAQQNLNKINVNYLPLENRHQFIQLKEVLPSFIAGLDNLQELSDFLSVFLGKKDLRRYLLVFQNDNELRATGGFMGSFSLVDFVDGDLAEIKMPAGGTYDVRAGFKELWQTPRPLQLINDRWEFQDANWWPDWPASARQISQFYYKSGGPTIDGVIAINSDWLSDLLLVTGPIDLPEYQKTITAANFEWEIQESIESERGDSRQPKKILVDLMPELIDRIFKIESESFLSLIKVLGDGLERKDILVYLFNEEWQDFIVRNGWSGEMKTAPFDYLQVVATNIGGGKTDNVVRQEIYHQANILADGSVINQILIHRHHFGPVEENFTEDPNRSYLRIYVPLGSQLIKASGFRQPAAKEFRIPPEFLTVPEELAEENKALIDPESQTAIYQERDKTVFANWLTLYPGESQDLILTYRLPFKFNFDRSNDIHQVSWFNRLKNSFWPVRDYQSYSLLIQKQPGGGENRINSQVVYPASLEPIYFYPHSLKIEDQNLIFDSQLYSDLFYFVNFQY